MSRGLCNNSVLLASKHKEASLSNAIGAVAAPLCMASAPDAFLGWPAAGSSDQFDPQNAGWAPDKLTWGRSSNDWTIQTGCDGLLFLGDRLVLPCLVHACAEFRFNCALVFVLQNWGIFCLLFV